AGAAAAWPVPARPLRIQDGAVAGRQHRSAHRAHGNPALTEPAHANTGDRPMSPPNRPPQTLAQKLIAKACGRPQVAVGEIVSCKVDLAMFHDSSGPRRLKPMLEELGAPIWDRSRIVLVMDHYVPERDDDSRRIVRIARDWARDQHLPHVYDS